MKEPHPVIREFELIDPEKDFTYYFDDLNDVRRRIVQDLSIATYEKFLDVGTGDGWFPMAVQESLPHSLVATIELSADEAAIAQGRARKLGDNQTNFLSMDGYEMGFAGEVFDGAGTFLAVQDICSTTEELYRFTSEIARVLKPNGLLAIATITPEDAETESQRLAIELYRYIRAGYFSKAELEQGLIESGFVVEPFRFYQTGVNLAPHAALEFIKFQCEWWVDTFQMPTVDWRTTWEKFGPRIEALGGVEVDAKISVVTARKR